MKKTKYAVAGACALVLPMLPTSTYAQASGVTLLGVVDAAVTYQSHASTSGNSVMGLQQGGEGFLSGSRFTIKGNEDLGNGLSAGFTLENGFLVDTGKLDQQGQLFGRQAFVRLGSDKLGEIAMGRQYTTANSMLYFVDPLGVGAAPSNAWMVFLAGQRYDNAITYSKAMGPVWVIAEYAFGETAGKPSATSSTSFGVQYQSGSITAVGDFQQTRDAQSRAARIYLGGVKWKIGKTSLFGNYIHSQRDSNFDSTKGGTDTATITSMTTAATPSNRAAFNSQFATRRQDDFFTVAATYELTPALSAIGSFMYDRTQADGFNGSRKTAYAVLDYNFSKRTDAYLAAAYDWVGGDWKGVFASDTTNWAGGTGRKLNGQSNQTTVMVGLRHKF